MLANKTDAAFFHVATETGMGAHCGFRRYMEETSVLTLQIKFGHSLNSLSGRGHPWRFPSLHGRKRRPFCWPT